MVTSAKLVSGFYIQAAPASTPVCSFNDLPQGLRLVKHPRVPIVFADNVVPDGTEPGQLGPALTFKQAPTDWFQSVGVVDFLLDVSPFCVCFPRN